MPKSLLRLAALAVAALLLLPAAASAGGTIRLTSENFTVNEGDGEAVITVVRTDASGRGEIRYDAYYDQSAEPDADWKPVQGKLDLAPGQTETEFRIPIVDDAIVEGPETVKIGIYGPYNATLGEPNRGKLDDRRQRLRRRRARRRESARPRPRPDERQPAPGRPLLRRRE